jgi:hypothetical protein
MHVCFEPGVSSSFSGQSLLHIPQSLFSPFLPSVQYLLLNIQIHEIKTGSVSRYRLPCLTNYSIKLHLFCYYVYLAVASLILYLHTVCHPFVLLIVFLFGLKGFLRNSMLFFAEVTNENIRKRSRKKTWV